MTSLRPRLPSPSRNPQDLFWVILMVTVLIVGLLVAGGCRDAFAPDPFDRRNCAWRPMVTQGGDTLGFLCVLPGSGVKVVY